MTAEEVRLRFGIDAKSVEVGTAGIMTVQRNAALEYKTIWGKAIADRVKMESEANDVSLAKSRAYLAEKSAMNRAWMEEQAAMSAIGGGSGGAGSGFRTAEQAALGEGEALAGGALAGTGAARGMREAGHAAHGFAGILRETMVIIREGLRGNFTRMVGSATILIGLIGTMAAAIAIPLAAILAIPGFRTYQAIKGEKASNASLKEATHGADSIARQRINELKRYGVIDTAGAQGFEEQLAAGNVNDVLTDVNQLMTKLPNARRMKAADKLAAEESKQLDSLLSKKRDEKTLEEDIHDKTMLKLYAQRELEQLDESSVEYHEAKARLLGYEIDIQKDLTSESEKQKQAAERVKQLHEENAKIARDYVKDQVHAAMDEAAYPSLENIAGRRWTANLNKRYGKGGQFDLGLGDGAFAANAQDYLLAQKQQEYDRTYGNNQAAEQDRQRMIAERNYLVASGVSSPEMVLGKIADDTGKLQELFRALVESGVIIKGTE